MFRRQGRQHDEARKEINLTAQQTFQISTSTALSKLMSLKSFFTNSLVALFQSLLLCNNNTDEDDNDNKC